MNDAQTLHQAGVLPTAGNVYRHFNGKLLSIVGMVVTQPGRQESAIVIFSQVPVNYQEVSSETQAEPAGFSHYGEQWLPISEFAQEHLMADVQYELGAHLVTLQEAAHAQWNWKAAVAGDLLGVEGKRIEFDPMDQGQWDKMDEEAYTDEQARCMALFMPSREFLNLDPLV